MNRNSDIAHLVGGAADLSELRARNVRAQETAHAAAEMTAQAAQLSPFTRDYHVFNAHYRAALDKRPEMCEPEVPMLDGRRGTPRPDPRREAADREMLAMEGIVDRWRTVVRLRESS